MIDGVQVFDGLFILERSPFKFYLTGSRYFGGARASSDYDFFCQEAEDVEEYLLAQNFIQVKPVDDAYFGVLEIVKIFRHQNVDVHMVKDAEKKLRVQQLLKDAKLITGDMTKPARKRVWQVALTVAKLS